MEALLQAAQPEDIPRLIQYYRALPLDDSSLRSFGLSRHPLTAFAASVKISRLVEEMRYMEEKGLGALLERAEWWLNVDLSWSETCSDDLESAFDNEYSGVLEVLLREAQRLVEERNDDLAGWQAAWETSERPVGYRRRALYIMLILQALVGQPPPTLKRRQQESLLGLGMLAQLSIDNDDQGRLEAVADKTEALLAILAGPRELVLPDIIERVVALGPEIVPRLIELLDPEDFGWTAIRACRAIERMARLHPGSCDMAIPKLIATIHEEQGDYLKEAASYALEAIGPAAVDLINKRLRRTRDMSREIYLTGVLGEIPVESATQVIIDKIKAGKPVEENEVMTLSDIGSASAIEPLYQLWKPGDGLLAEQLLILCQLNGVEKSELSEWRRLVEAEDKRMTNGVDDLPKMLEEGDFLAKLEELANSPRPLIPTWQLEKKQPKAQSTRKKPVRKKTKKKGIVQHKRTKGKKKKRSRR